MTPAPVAPWSHVLAALTLLFVIGASLVFILATMVAP